MPLGPATVSLEGRVALVTGAAAGIGEAIALTLASFGADLAICDRDEVNLETTARSVRALGRRAWTGRLDVRDGEAVGAFVARVGAEAGRVDVLVNNAGGGFHAAFAELSAHAQDALIAENFTSVTNCIRATLPLFPDTGGSILNISSIEAGRGAPGYAIYAAMKAAVENLTRTLALELGARRIRVNAIAPDLIPTPGIGDPQVRAPLARKGHPNHVAGAALFLASDLSLFVTGTTLHVDGGTAAAGGWRLTEDGRYTL